MYGGCALLPHNLLILSSKQQFTSLKFDTHESIPFLKPFNPGIFSEVLKSAQKGNVLYLFILRHRQIELIENNTCKSDKRIFE